MFGIVRPCRHRLRGSLFVEWTAHLCGLCLTLRDLHGQSARLVTNYDGLLVSVLAEAQNPATAPHRIAGPCALRRFRSADVLDTSATGAQLAAAVSLVLAAGKIRDHVADRDGAYARRLVASGAGLAARRWQLAGQRTGASVGFDTDVLSDAIARQVELERTSGLRLHEVTEPTETAVSAAFAHTAVLAGRPANAGSLAEAGRHFGRIAHLLDAVTDLAADDAAGSYNPLVATGTTPTQARASCADAVAGLRSAVASLELERPALTESLLIGEVDVAVDRVFRQIMRDAGFAGYDGSALDGDPSAVGPGGAGPGGVGPGGAGPGDVGPGPPPEGQPGQPVDPFKQAPWEQASDPSQLRSPATRRRRADWCGDCCDGAECCGVACEAVGDCASC
jgi:hypothetical protein